MTTLPLGVSPANPTHAPRVPAGRNSFAAAASFTTRRALLGALAAIPVAAAASPAVSASPGSAAQVSPDLTKAILHQRRASALAHKYAETMHTPAYDAWQADVARIPHIATVNSFGNVMGEEVALSTSNDGTVATSRRVLANIDAGKLPSAPADYTATLRELIGAADERDAERDRLRLHHRVDATGERCDRLTDRSLEAIDAALAIPARNVADLAAKIAFISEVEWWDVPAAHDAISSDARRLAGEA